MRAILCLVLLLTASSARAELFEMSGSLQCAFLVSGGNVEKQKLNSRQIVAAALDADEQTAKRFALAWNSESFDIEVVRRCDGAQQTLFADNSSSTSGGGEPGNGKAKFGLVQLLDVVDWDGSVEDGSVSCSLTGSVDQDTGDLQSAKASCTGALTIFVPPSRGYCGFRGKVTKKLKITNDCPT